MRNKVLTVLIAAVAFVLLTVPAFAHHGNASYDGGTLTIKGTVTEWLWANPHTFLKLDVTDENGKVTHWICENQAPSTLVNFGFTPKTFKPGDVVTVVLGARSKTLPVGRISKVILANGFVMNSEVR